MDWHIRYRHAAYIVAAMLGGACSLDAGGLGSESATPANSNDDGATDAAGSTSTTGASSVADASADGTNTSPNPTSGNASADGDTTDSGPTTMPPQGSTSSDDESSGGAESTGPGDGVIIACSYPNVSLPDADYGGVFESVFVDTPGTVQEVWISVVETHGAVGHIGVRLHHDDVDPLLVFGVPNGDMSCSGDDIDVVIRDGAPADVQSTCGPGTPALDGELAPLNPLSIFQGMQAQGEWVLQTADMVGGVTGTLDEWCLMLTLE